MTYDPCDLDRLLPPLPVTPATSRPADAAALSDDDAELINQALASYGPAFRKLWNGDASDYRDKDHPNGNLSRADWGLCKDLLRATGFDAERTEQLARQSKLKRDKWDEKHAGDGRTYLRLTIDNALEDPATYRATEAPARESIPVAESKPDDPDVVCMPRAEYERLVTLATEREQIRDVLRSGLTPAVRIGVVAFLDQVWQAETRAHGQRHLIVGRTLAKRFNVSEDVITQASTFIAEAGVIDKTLDYELVDDERDTARTRTVRQVNQQTGEITETQRPKLRPHLQVRAKAMVSRPDSWAIVVRAAPATKPERAKPGSRTTCPRDGSTLELQPVCPVEKLPLGVIQQQLRDVDVGFQPPPTLCTEESGIGRNPPSSPSVVSTADSIGHREPAVSVAYQDGQAALLECGRELNWMPVQFKQGYSIPMGEASWRRFAELANGDLSLALDAARRQVDLVREFSF